MLISRRPLLVFGIVAGIIGFLLSGCSTVRKSADFSKRAGQIQRAVVVSTDIDITRVVFKGDNETLFEEGKAATKHARHVLEEELARRGFDVEPFEFISEKFQENPDLELQLSKLKEKHAALAEDVQNHFVKKLKWGGFSLSLGSEVNQLADLVGVDVLIFSKGAGFVKSGGEIAKDLTKTMLIAAASLGSVVYIESSYGGTFQVSVVDGDNGNILWHNFSNPGMAYNLTKEGGVEAIVKQSFSPFPKRKSYQTLLPIQEGLEGDDIEGRRRKINIPYEAVKLTAETGLVAGETSWDLSKEALKASASLGKAVPRSAFNLLTLGAYRAKHGETKSAVRAYESAIKADSKNPWAYLLLAESYRQIGELKKAEGQLRKSIQLNPSIPQSHKILSEILQEKEKHTEAKTELEIYNSLEAEINRKKPPFQAKSL